MISRFKKRSAGIRCMRLRGTIDLTHLARVECREPFGAYEVIERGGQKTIGHVGVFITGDGTKVGTGPLEPVRFVKDDPGASIIESEAGLSTGWNLDGQALVGGWCVRHREDRDDLLTVPGRGCKQDSTGTILATLLASGFRLVAPEKRIADDEAGHRIGKRH